MYKRCDGLRVIDAGLRSNDEQAELFGFDARDGEHSLRRLGRERDGVFTRLGDRHLARAEAVRVLRRIDAAAFGEIDDVDVAAQHGDGDRIDSYSHRDEALLQMTLRVNARTRSTAHQPPLPQ